MKYVVLVATMLSALTVVAPSAQAQQGYVPTVAILDLTYIFKNHARFQAMKNDMRRDLEAAEAQLNSEKEAFQKLVQRLEDYRKGTPEYKALEEEIAKRQADLNLQVNIQKKNFLEQEAKIYYDVYQEVMEHTRVFAEQNGIQLVIKFNGDPIDRNDPQDVFKELNKFVLYYNPAIDVTPKILELVNASAPRAPVAPGVGARPPVAPQGVFPR